MIKVQLFSRNRSNLENRILWHVRIAQEIKKHFRLRENNEVNEILIAFATVKSSSKTTIHGYIFCLMQLWISTICIHEVRLLLYILWFVNKQFMHLYRRVRFRLVSFYTFLACPKIIKIMHSHLLLFTVFVYECQMELTYFDMPKDRSGLWIILPFIA